MTPATRSLEERTMTTHDIEKREAMLRDLTSTLAAQVEAGDITDMQANEWHAMKADQWANGL